MNYRRVKEQERPRSANEQRRMTINKMKTKVSKQIQVPHDRRYTSWQPIATNLISCSVSYGKFGQQHLVNKHQKAH